MFNRNLFKAKCMEKGVSMERVASFLGVNLATLYRKMSGQSDFTRYEIQLFKCEMHLSTDDVEKIFFA